MWRHATAVLLLLCTVKPAAADEIKPSFDCTAARSAAEKMICSDAQLASWDQTLAEVYADTLRAGRTDKAAQIEWLKRRDADCATGDLRECLLRHIRLRVAVLQQTTGVGPSFDCGAARSETEYAICTEGDLAQLDLIVANAYRHALDAGRIVAASQVQWLRRRDAECRAPDKTQAPQREDEFHKCLSDHMLQRLEALQQAYGFAYGTATCSPQTETVAITFDIPPVPKMDIDAGYGAPFPQRLLSWRCDVTPRRSVTVRYGFWHPTPSECATASIWENGVKIATSLELCGFNFRLQSITISPSGLEVCYFSDEPKPGRRCNETARRDLPTVKDPYFAPGRAPGQPEPPLTLMPMQQLQGSDNPRCKLFADRLTADFNDDFADLEAKVDWHDVAFPNTQFPPEIAVAAFDIDNDGQPETVLRENYNSRAAEGERYTIFPRDSWVSDLRVVNNDKEFYAAINAAVSSSASANPGNGYRLANPFSATSGLDHYSQKVLTIDGRTIMFASPINYYPPAKWQDADPPDSPARIFFEVGKAGTITTICSFAPPYHLGAQL
jgi:uncharacterized protein